jgi:PAS domain S-box-containing protein
MKIKTKASLGISVLAALIIGIGLVSTFFIYRLSDVSGEIIKDNYISIGYCRDMLKSLDNMQQSYILYAFSNEDNTIKKVNPDYKHAVELFDKRIKEEESNITEVGEKEAVAALRISYENYFSNIEAAKMLPISQSRSLLSQMTVSYNETRNNIITIMNINLGAIARKNNIAQKASHEAIIYVSIIGVLSLFILLPILFNFPGYIANPIIEVKEKIKEIANRNYDQKLTIRRKDELGELADEFNKMTDKLQEFQRSNYAELMTEKSRVDSIVRNLNEGLILLDEDYRIKVLNPVAAELLGLEPKEVLERYAPDIAIKNDLFRELIKDLDEKKKGTNGKPLRITIGSEENFFHKEIFKVQKDNTETGLKETSGFIISLRNITEFKKLDLAKTNFIAIVSHELKTPISSISLSLKLLEDERVGSLNSEQKKLVHLVKDEASRLSKITGELLDMSQVESGNIKLQIESVNPSDIIRITADVMSSHIRAKNISLIQDISGGLSNVKADLEKTVWVMTNLLANAIRYTPENGKITISAHRSLKEVQFSVEDTGPGIEVKNKEKIFQRFVQVDSSKQREGVGLGLAISKEFIQEEGGRIWVESELGVGSKFVFTLPVA